MSGASGIVRERKPIVLGCLGALVMGIFSCCAFAALATAPAFGDTVPAPPVTDVTRHDITMLMREEFMNRALLEALPDTVPVKGEMDVQPGNRLVFNGEVSLVIAKVQVVMTMRLTFEDGSLRMAIESIEAGGRNIQELLGVDGSALSDAMSGLMQRQIEEGLGPGAEILGISTDDEQIIIRARWAQ